MPPRLAALKGCCFLAAATIALQGQAGQGDRWQADRTRMVETQLKARGIHSPAVLNAMSRVPRHLLVPQNVRDLASTDQPLPIGQDQTISQPYIVAYMTEALDVRADQSVLEIGTGSGYQAAVLAELA